ncbi:hypothetical protein RUM44_004022 [Polyplax serrata]
MVEEAEEEFGMLGPMTFGCVALKVESDLSKPPKKTPALSRLSPLNPKVHLNPWIFVLGPSSDHRNLAKIVAG